MVGIFALVGLSLAPTLGCASRSANGTVRIPVDNEAVKIAQAQRLALQAQRAEDPVKAIALYQQALTVYRDLAPVWNNLGVLLMEQQQYLDAAEAFTTASEVQPTDPRPLYNLGLTWERAGYLKDSLRYYSQALERDPRFQPALLGAIRAERLLGEASEETLRRIRMALGQEQNEDWRLWLELQRPQVEAEVYRAGQPD